MIDGAMMMMMMMIDGATIGILAPKEGALEGFFFFCGRLLSEEYKIRRKDRKVHIYLR